MWKGLWKTHSFLTFLPHPLTGNTCIHAFPQMEEVLESLATIGECRFVDIFTLSTTTNFLLLSSVLYLGTVHNQSLAYAVEAR